jgi:hypothetical protein
MDDEQTSAPAERCERCGLIHTGDCPVTADELAAAEPCAFCGERHPRRFKCGEWAQLTGVKSESPWGGAGFARLPELPPVVIKPHREPTATDRRLALAGKALFVLLALVGVVSLVLFVVGRTGGTAATSASLPACTRDRILANLNHVNTILAEGTTSTPMRVDETNALLLKSSESCNADLLALYDGFIEYQALCLEQAPGACASRDSTRTALAQTLANGGQ